MNAPLSPLLFAASLITVIVPELPAQETPPYEPVHRAAIEAGAWFPQSTDLSGFPGSSGTSKLELNPGFRVGIGSAYALKPYFSVDWEAALLVSSVKNGGALDEFDATMTQVPFLISGVFQYENATAFTPFLGVGVGAASTAINVHEARIGVTSLEGSDYDFVFAWQIAAGLRYAVNERLGLGISYKYLWTGNAEWEFENDAISATGDQKLEINGIRSHAILGYLSYRF
jgi:opacity protein-like surface antigen